MSKFLNSPEIEAKCMGEKIVSICAYQCSDEQHSDKEFIYAFFDHLLKDNKKGVLLRLKSPELEDWLSKKYANNPDILLSYYQVQEQHYKAGKRALELAQEETGKTPLTNRIEYLEISISNFLGALEENPLISNDTQSVMNTAKSLLNVAKLQSLICNSIGSTKFVTEEDDMKLLGYALLDASTLYNDFAFDYEMYDICILLFHACGYDNVPGIKKAWKDLLCSEVFPCSTRNNEVYQSLERFRWGSSNQGPPVTLLDSNSNETDPIFENGFWIIKVEETIKRLGKEVYHRDSNAVFPIDYLGECLEDLRRTYASAKVSKVEALSQEWTFKIL
jgi:nuclear pore complex protein Nup155